MNYIFETNYAVFSVFAALLITEVIGSILLLLFYDAAKAKVLEYIVPIWEVTGTFGAFWVVTGDMAYPSLLIPVASIFGALLTVFLILLVARNSTIVFAEFIVKRRWLDERKLYKGYAVSTLLMGVTVLVLVSSLVSGAGVLSNSTPLSSSFNLGAWASQAGSWLFLVGTLLIAIGVAPIFFDIRPFAKRFIPLAVVGALISVAAYYEYSSSLVTSYMAVPVVITLLAVALYIPKKTAPMVTNKAVFIAFLSIIIFSLQSLIYPKFVGQALRIDSFTTTGPMVSVFYETTWVGSALLAVMLLVYVWIAFRQKRMAGQAEAPVPAPTAGPAQPAVARAARSAGDP
jgi:cytochrome d ubiquinol oxidase subunit II